VFAVVSTTPEASIGSGTLIVVPTYNERENAGRLIDQILEMAPGAEVLVIDDGSPDGTGEVVTEIAAREPRVHLLERGRKLGLGTAYVAGFKYGLEREYARVMTMDADFSHHPRHLPAILAAAAEPGVDVAIGSRYVKGGGVVGWGPHRKLLSFGANTFARTMLGLSPHDCTGAYRCYSRATLQRLDLAAPMAHGYSALIELLWHCRRLGLHIREVPITFADRELGESKISSSEIRRGLTTVLRLRFKKARLTRTVLS
jgi:glycosyltransferase involved in cell wall biosynthesis